MLFVSRLGTGTLLPVTTAPDTPLRAHAMARADGSVNLVLANTHPSRDLVVVIELAEPAESVEELQLRAPSLDATSGFTFAGAGVTAEGEWAARPPLPFKFPDGGVRTVASELVHAGSAIIVHLR
jgi:hypothetical protein